LGIGGIAMASTGFLNDCTTRILALCAISLCSAVLATGAQAAALVDGIVVRMRVPEAMSAETRQRIGMALALGFNDAGRTRDGGHRLELAPPQDIDTVRAALNRLRLDPGVLYAAIAAREQPSVAAPAPFALPTDRIIVRWRASVVSEDSLDGSSALAQARLGRIAAAAGASLAFVRPMHDGANVLRLGRRASLAEVEAMAARIAADPEVELAQPDYIRQIHLQASDPCYAKQSLPGCGGGYQWDLFEPAGGINAPAAWDITTGSSSIVVGVLDTGGLFDHPDLASRLVAGYDMVDDALVANDNDPKPMCNDYTVTGCFGSRDGNAADPGDWLTQAQVSSAANWFFGCDYVESSFHGSHVAGTIGAAPDNGTGVAGINWVSKVQPVRVLGRCGGYTSDIADGVVWASGGTLSGAPPSATPARVINVSLGGFAPTKTCDGVLQGAINSALSRNTVVVVSAGNNNFDASYASPANCSGVITVAATGQRGFKAWYSNFGPLVEIAAPGGDSTFDIAFNPNRLGILSTLNDGVQVPISTIPTYFGGGPPDPKAHTYVQYQGTSMAAPHVTGVVSLMLSVNPALTPAQVASKLSSSARAFPTGAPACNTTNDPIADPLPVVEWKLCTCTTALCGAGIVDAAAAVNASFPATPGSAVVTQNPYGAFSVSGATQSGNTISNIQPTAAIQLGSTPGTPGSFVQIDVAGFSMGPSSILTIRSGAANQSVLLVNSDPNPSNLSGTIAAAGNPGTPAPMLMIRNAKGINVHPSGTISGPNGLSLSALGPTPLTGERLVLKGLVDGGPSLQLRGAGITGGATLKGNGVFIGTFGAANNPVNGAYFLQNGLRVFPSTGPDVALTLNGYGTSPQVFNVHVTGNATVSMPSAGTPGAPPNNAPLAPGATRPPGQGAPGYGGGSMILQATGSMKVAGGVSNDFVFPGAIVLKAGASLDLNGVVVNQGWSTGGQAFQGIFFEAPVIASSRPGVKAYGNNLNWVNFSTLPQMPVQTFTLSPNADGSASFAPADGFAPHRNAYSVVTHAAASGQCWTCLVNHTPIVVYP
jgi:serine protease